VAQERLQYEKALSFSKQALDVMAQRRILLADVSVANLSEKEKQLIDNMDKPNCDLEALCNQSLGSIYFDMGNYDEAMKHANEAITLAEGFLKNSSNDNPGTQLALAWALYLRGRVENVSGSLDNAKADLKRAMLIRQTVKLPHPEELAITMANLASTYTMQKDYRAAERLIDEALKMLEGSTEKAMQVARATVQFHRAEMKIHSGDYDNAEAVLNECIALREKLLQPNHPHIAEAYLVAAKLSQQKGRSSEAALQREKAIAILKFCFGDKHPLISNGGTIKTTSNTVNRTNYAKY
jgi:tetratricopeptide (TPR) repeat protein